MKQIPVWAEGYAATGEHGTAQLMGTYEAETFDDAVELMLKEKENGSWPDIRRFYDKSPSGYHRIWACRLCDNEKEARESFG